MKYYKRLKIYKGQTGNCTFDPNKIEALSYRWWKFVSIIEGKVVFNSYRYSSTTAKHQNNVRYLMRDLGIKIDFEVSTSSSLHSANNSLQALEDLVIETLNETEFHETEKRARRLERARQKRQQQKLALTTAKPILNLQDKLKYHVSGAIERGEAEPIVAVTKTSLGGE